MQEAFDFATAAPLIVAVVALARAMVPQLKKGWVPPLVVALTVAWGGVLVVTGRFTGDAAEFVVASVMVATAAMGGASVVSTYTRENSAINRVT